MLPTPTSLCTVSTMNDYHIFTFGEEGSYPQIITVMREGKCHDSYVVVADRSYLSLPFEKG